MSSSDAVTVTVYSKPVGCMACKFTLKTLDRLGIAYTVVDVTTNDEALAYVSEELGYAQVPVVIVDQDPQNHWSGLKESKIEALVAKR